MNINEKIWMVKSSGRLLGPLSLAEVVIHLQQQTISVIDEIRSPYDRWVFVREQPLVMSILKEMSDTASSGLSDNTNTQEKTSTRTVTKTLTEVTEELPTEDLTISQESTNAANQAYQKLIRAKEKEVTSSSAVAATKSYATDFDKRFQERVEAKKRSQKYTFIALLGVLIIVVAATFSYEFKKQKDRMTMNMKNLNQAREMIQIGQYQSALELYEKVYLHSPELFSTTDILNYSLLLVKVSNRIGSAENVLASVQKPENFIDWRHWMMCKLNLYFAKESWDEARLILNELIVSLPNDPEVRLAAAQSELFSGRYATAYDILMQNMQLFRESTKYLDQAAILMAQVAIFGPKSSYRAMAFTKALELLQISSIGFDPYFFSKKILLAALQLELNPDLSKRSIEDIWGMNIFDQDKFVTSLTTVKMGVDMVTLLPICIDLSKVIETFSDPSGDNAKYKDYSVAIEAICRFFSGNRLESFKVLALARKQRPSSAILASVEANLLLSDEREPEASARTALCGNLPYCLLAKMRECFVKEDDKCLSAMLNQTSEKWVGPYYNLVSAEIAKKRGNDFYQKDQILKGLQQFPDYQPLMVRRP